MIAESATHKAPRAAAGRREVLALDPHRVKPFAGQPRKRFRGIAALARSIELVGQITPIVVAPLDEPGFDAELVDGERRLRACRHAGLPVQAVFEGQVPAATRFALAIAANFCRQEHDAVEVAEAVRTLADQGRDNSEIAGIFGKSLTWVCQHKQLLALAPEVLDRLKRPDDAQGETKRHRRRPGKLTFSLALLLAPLAPADQIRAVAHIEKKRLRPPQARSYILRLIEARGKKPNRNESPRSQLEKFWSALDVFRHRVDRIAGMRYAELEPILLTVRAREAETFAGQIDEVAENLKMLAWGLRAIAKGNR